MPEHQEVTESSLSEGTSFALVAVGATAENTKQVVIRGGLASFLFLSISVGFLLLAALRGLDLDIPDLLVPCVAGLIGVPLLIHAISSYKTLRSVHEAKVTCSGCGHTQSILAAREFVRCPECRKLIWLPRSKEETSAVARCPICGELNTLPAGGAQPTRCPNCYALLHVAADGAARLAEEERACPQCGARVAASSWMCPQCLAVLREEIVPSPVHPTDKVFINGIGPSGALAAAAHCLEQVRTHLRQADLVTDDPGDETLTDFSYPFLACYYLFRAAKQPSARERVLQLFGYLDDLYGLLLLRLYLICRNLSEDQHQGFLRRMNAWIATIAPRLARCERGLQQQGLIDSEPPVDADRWLVQLPVTGEGRWEQHAAGAKAVLVEQIFPGLGALSYLTRERKGDRVLLQPDRLRDKALGLLGTSNDLTDEQLEALYRRKLEAAPPVP